MSDPKQLPAARVVAEWLQTLDPDEIPQAVQRACTHTLIDTLGLSIAARQTDYVAALRSAWPSPGPCTVLGCADTREMTGAAMINGTAAHGEDFDTTFEGCPVHAGAVVVPAVLAAAENWHLSGAQASKGIAVGMEIMSRLGLIAQKGIHTAGFHPTAVLGTMAATAGVAAAANLPAAATANAFGIAGSMASGIIEYLADGSWTKRMHAGWAAQSGLRAVAMAQAGFTGPASVFEGSHGLFHGFAPSIDPDFEILTADLGVQWHTERTAFKPYACGTMTQPFVDCAIQLAQTLRVRSLRADDIATLTCHVGEGTVHRLWEPLALKQRPPNAYAAKFSGPYCVAVGLLHGDAGLAEFSEAAVRDEAVLKLAERVGYEIDPDDDYPRNYTGRIIATLSDGRSVEAYQPHLRGGSRAPLTRDELVRKCAANIRYGDRDAALTDRLVAFADSLHGVEAPVSLTALAADR
jgi:2-methylcitrate dehydratase PrpD